MKSETVHIDYDRLAELNSKIKAGSANRGEKEELMTLLHNNGSISEKQYRNYKSGRNVEDIFEAALIIGGIVLFGKILDSLISNK